MPKVIKINQDGTKEEYAGKDSSAGAGDAGEFVVLDSTGKISASQMPSGIGADVISATAGEALAAGDFVYIDGSGNVLKADASAIGKKAHGYVKAAVANGAPAEVYFDDDNPSLTGLTPGTTYYLSASTPGAVTTTAPTAVDEIVQVVGFAFNATTIHVDIDENPVIRK